MIRFPRELKSTLFTLALPLAVALVFPYEAVSFRARPAGAPAPASAALVVLSPADEAAALKSAKSAWQRETRSVRVRLPLGVLPSADEQGVLADRFPRTTLPFPEAPFGFVPYAPSSAAKPVRRLPSSAHEAALAFPRTELLELRF